MHLTRLDYNKNCLKQDIPGLNRDRIIRDATPVREIRNKKGVRIES